MNEVRASEPSPSPSLPNWQFGDLTIAPDQLVDNFALPLAVASVVGVIATIWEIIKGKRHVRFESTLKDRSDFANGLRAVCNQFSQLKIYDNGLTQGRDWEWGWAGIKTCMEIMSRIAHQDLAPTARGKGSAGFSRKEAHLASMLVGMILHFADKGYVYSLKARTEQGESPVRIAPAKLKLRDWEKMLVYSTKVFDPTRRTFAGKFRLKFKLLDLLHKTGPNWDGETPRNSRWKIYKALFKSPGD